MYKEKTITAIIQARMSSSRLPNKMMLWLHGYPVIGWVLRRVSKSKYIDRVVFAIPDTSSNDVLEKYIAAHGCEFCRGSEDDVLGRYRMAVRMFHGDWLIRICADNPLIAASEIDSLIEHFFESRADFSYNNIPKNNLYPDGLGAEIIDISSFNKLKNLAITSSHREHVFNSLWDHQDLFRISTFDPIDIRLRRPDLKLDLDTYHDYSRLLSFNISVDSSAYQVVSAALDMQRTG